MATVMLELVNSYMCLFEPHLNISGQCNDPGSTTVCFRSFVQSFVLKYSQFLHKPPSVIHITQGRNVYTCLTVTVVHPAMV